MDNSLLEKLHKYSEKQLRIDRQEIFLELTKSICPDCKKNLDARIVVKDNKMFMGKECPEHGYFKGLILSDSEWYLKSLKFNKPGSLPLHFNSKNSNLNNCPDDCGLCPRLAEMVWMSRPNLNLF